MSNNNPADPARYAHSSSQALEENDAYDFSDAADQLPDIIDLVHAMDSTHAVRSENDALTNEVTTNAAANLTETPAYALPHHLAPLADHARRFRDASQAAHTRRAYASDWAHFSDWCQRQGLSPLPADVQIVGLYITACATGSAGLRRTGVATITRRLSALNWNFVQRGQSLDRQDRHIATVL
ncbi:integrase, partial [Paraburkholderia aspalathi]|nr:integrase [Paraburkholderia aspalathi]